MTGLKNPDITHDGDPGQPRVAPSGSVHEMTPTPEPKDGVHVAVQRTPDTRTADGRTPRTGADWLRFVPPIAALGTAFVLQVVVITDTVGGAMSGLYGGQWPYIVAALLGVSVASCAEGGAAYLMDLYDRHLLARDSVWLLRTAMVVYVGVSAGAIHWWTDMRGLPSVISWLLAGMSASALFLWARGSRWRNRQAMIAAGQIDPALPRLPIAAKVLHPVRWLVTLHLISWDPATTTAQARKRYRQWKHDQVTGGNDDLISQFAALCAQQAMFFARIAAVRAAESVLSSARVKAAGIRASAEEAAEAVRLSAESDAQAVRTAAAEDAHVLRSEVSALREQAQSDHLSAVQVQAEADRVLAEAKRTAADLYADSGRPVRLVASNGARRTASPAKTEVSVEQLADTLADRFPDRVPGRPTAIKALSEVYGSCSNDRAREAVRLLSARRESSTRTGQPDSGDDQERAS